MYQQFAEPQQGSTQSRKMPKQSFLSALQTILSQHLILILKPSIAAFRLAQYSARWSLVLLQALILSLILWLINWIASFIPTASLHTLSQFISSHFDLLPSFPSSLNSIIWVFGAFLIGLVTAYLLSKLAKGKGTLLAHTYLLFLCTLPLVTLGGLLLLLPATSILFPLVISLLSLLLIYRLILHTMVIIAVHQLKTGMAILIALVIPMLLLLIVLFFLTEGRFLEGVGEALGDIFSSRKKKRTQLTAKRS